MENKLIHQRREQQYQLNKLFINLFYNYLINFGILFFCSNIFSPLFILAQDGSSELISDKTPATSVLSSTRLRVRCTDDSLRLYPNATSCPDERDPESCRMIFTTTASSNPATRDPKCDNPLLKDLAEQCRRTCAICCEDASYACQNDESGIVNCNQNTEKCGMSEFSAMMVKFCPATCGLCLTKRCKDQIDDCEDMKSLCTNEIYSTFMEHQCAKTCGKCGTEEEDGGEKGENSGEEENGEILESKNLLKEKGSIEEMTEEEIDVSKERQPIIQIRGKPKNKNVNETIIDLWKNCKRNKKFCHHPSYRVMMKKNCAKTCGYYKSEKGNEKHFGNFNQSSKQREKKECRDAHPFCKGWAKNGYCDSDEYSEEEKRDKCSHTCGLC
ncbi:hypothetical protein Mgra_00004730 [Meloidogyne graminicola]|uniref:ShKT domain-containing protein n=1 Tax=Meloidogyne graminicola TaxID=189291 RepID=A0A8S9ZQC5_9BILA|nr:hypothetical protein Mgra_00004730 [Meloidogyne graminicola]